MLIKYKGVYHFEVMSLVNGCIGQPEICIIGELEDPERINKGKGGGSETGMTRTCKEMKTGETGMTRTCKEMKTGEDAVMRTWNLT